MEKFLFPWESRVVIKYPFALPIFILILGTILSIITWVRRKKS